MFIRTLCFPGPTTMVYIPWTMQFGITRSRISFWRHSLWKHAFFSFIEPLSFCTIFIRLIFYVVIRRRCSAEMDDSKSEQYDNFADILIRREMDMLNGQSGEPDKTPKMRWDETPKMCIGARSAPHKSRPTCIHLRGHFKPNLLAVPCHHRWPHQEC